MAGATDAIAAVSRHATARRDECRARLAAVLGGDTARLDGVLSGAGRLTLNFHPDRLDLTGRSAAAGLLADGRYLSQWVTGSSNGGRSATAGGDRARWEERLFGGAYDGAAPDERPVYGALDLLLDPHGGSPRFGSSFVVLADHVRRRSTFCLGDSHVGPNDLGTVAEPWPILAGLAEQASAGSLLGRTMTLDRLPDVFAGSVVADRPSRLLDDYVEAQVHGGVDLHADVVAMVVDPSFRGTAVGDDLDRAAERFGFALEWHAGSELAAADVPAGFRPSDVRSLARRVARPDGLVDAAAIGRFAATEPVAPPSPSGDAPDSHLQRVKHLWHALLAFGRDAPAAGR